MRLSFLQYHHTRYIHSLQQVASSNRGNQNHNKTDMYDLLSQSDKLRNVACRCCSYHNLSSVASAEAFYSPALTSSMNASLEILFPSIWRHLKEASGRLLPNRL